MEPIQLTLAQRDDFLLATGLGRVSTARLFGGDRRAVGRDLYLVGKAMAEYCESKSIHPKLAVIGKPPTVTGFGAEVASNRGLISKTFSESQSALNWLRAFGSRAQGS